MENVFAESKPNKRFQDRRDSDSFFEQLNDDIKVFRLYDLDDICILFRNFQCLMMKMIWFTGPKLDPTHYFVLIPTKTHRGYLNPN